MMSSGKSFPPSSSTVRSSKAASRPGFIFDRCVQDLPELPDVLEEQFGAPVEHFDLLRVVAMGEKLPVEESLSTLVSAAAGAAHGKVA